MNISELLNKKQCKCGKCHECAIKKVVIEENAILKINELVKDYKNIVMVADTNTYGVCGDSVKAQIGDKCENILIYEREGVLVPDEKAIYELDDKISDKTDLIIGVGSGVIQDLSKYVSFKNNIPYFIVATAPSMDGYASSGAAMIINKMKITYNAHVTTCFIGDINILKNAPMDMIKSGYGDILGKFSCLNDWKLSKVVNDEYFCDYVYNLTFDMLDKTKNLGAKLLKRNGEAIKTLTEALIGVGIAMAYVGNSRPASGSEHHLSHFFEITGLANNEAYFMHGIDVAYSCVYTQKLREKILEIDKPEKMSEFNYEEYVKNINRIYKGAAKGVIELQNKLGWYKKSRIDIYKEKWDEIKEVLKEAESSDNLIGYLKTIDLDISDCKNMYKEEKINDAIWFAKDLKDRYTVLWLYYCLFYK